MIRQVVPGATVPFYAVLTSAFPNSPPPPRPFPPDHNSLTMYTIMSNKHCVVS